MKKYYGVLLDTTSIQQYVFGSSKLKENLGASYIISNIYEEITEADKDGTYICDKVGYIGGGNALLFFEDKSEAIKFIKNFTRDLLIKAPGVSIACAISDGTIDLDDTEKFNEFKEALFNKLDENKGKYVPVITLPSHGINEECPRTGYSAESWYEEKHDEGEEGDYISSIAKTKLNYYEPANLKFIGDFNDVLGKLDFPLEFEDLGSSKGEDSHIAIVHIDGNGVGEEFGKRKTLKEIKDLSKILEDSVTESFKFLLETIIQEKEKIEKEISWDNKKLIPIRPIILGGDDITFVCDGRLGIYFAKKFIEKFEIESKLTACAGVAIIKQKYPFYKGYILAEELCGNAKSVRKNIGRSEGSWIDFHIAYAGISAPIEDIRDKYFKIKDKCLLIRPYRLSRNKNDIYDFDKIIENTRLLIKKDSSEKQILSSSKIKELREVLTCEKEIGNEFLNQLKSKGITLPNYHIDYNYSKSLFQNNVTPYFDMIELTELYPKFELE
ncbi:MAG: hypothetical protein EHM58_00190 [Ignavibacteriae bacterium]|nr:MAG: hypothetical protein EHM58_00190 [Ignavibacteriota bacterium]